MQARNSGAEISQHGLVAETVDEVAPEPERGEVAELACRRQDNDDRHRVAQRPEHIDGEKWGREIGGKIPGRQKHHQSAEIPVAERRRQQRDDARALGNRRHRLLRRDRQQPDAEKADHRADGEQASIDERQDVPALLASSHRSGRRRAARARWRARSLPWRGGRRSDRNHSPGTRSRIQEFQAQPATAAIA